MIKVNDVIEVIFPFYKKDKYIYDGEGGSYKVNTWNPGTLHTYDMNENDIFFAEGEGRMILTIIDIHKPGRFPTRIFYTRQWIDPDGKVFGKTNLNIKTEQGFKNICNGYRYEYEVVK